MLSKFIAALQRANLDMTAEEIADSLWLASHMGSLQEEIDFESETNFPQSRLPEDSLLGQRPLSLLSQTSSQSEASANVHLASPHAREETPSRLSGLPFRSPAGSALPNALAISRALRPLMRRIPSKTAVVLNERATAQNIAETQASVWMPIFDPAPMRWFDIELVIDAGASMQLWQETIAELRVLLERLGAFRDVRLWRLATDDQDRVNVYAGISSAQTQTRARNPRELISPGGHRLILVVSDCVSPAWHSGKVQDVLNLWGQKNLVTLMQVLPRRLWPQTTLAAADMVQLYTSQSIESNTQLQTWKPLEEFDEDITAKLSLPLPVVTLEPRSLSSWARVITRTRSTWISGVRFENYPDAILEESLTELNIYDLSPQKRVQLFRTSASSLARKLAGLLAAAPVPISLSVIRQIQHTMVPEASQIHVAEVFLGGLLEEIYQDEKPQAPDQVEYDFIAGARDELINTVPIPDAHRVFKELSAFVRDRYGQPRDFPALLATPGEVRQGATITRESRPFAQIELSALRRFGGPFGPLIDELEQRIRRTAMQRDELLSNPGTLQTVAESSQEYSTIISPGIVSPRSSFLSNTWCDFNWTDWLPLNSPALPTHPGVYRVRAVGGNEIFYIGLTGRNLKERIGDLYRNVMRDATQMPFRDPHIAAPVLWAWRDATGIDFACSILSLPSQENFDALVHYLLWQYRLEKGSSTLANHGRFHPQYMKSRDRKTGQRGYRLPEGQFNSDGGPSYPPLQLIATPPEKTWMGLTWSELYPLRSINLQHIASSSGIYKILNADTLQLLFIGSSRNLRTIFQSQARKSWNCPNPLFAFSVLPETILPYQINEIENDLFGGYYAQVKAAPVSQFGNRKGEEELDI